MSTSQVLFGPSSSYNQSSSVSSTLSTSHSVTLTGLTPSTTYHYSLVSANSYGLETPAPDATFTTTVQGPVISYVVVSGITSSGATITWTTDIASSSQVNYGTTSNYGSASTLDPTQRASHSVTLTGLATGTTYDFAAVSTSSSNGASTSSPNLTFTTTGGASTTDIAVNATVIQPTVKKLGINLGTLDNSDSGQMMKNLITTNPGFEGQIWNSTIQCAAVGQSTCTDANPYSSWPKNFWTNATYEIISGPSKGLTGTVYNAAAASVRNGINFTPSPLPNAGDYIIVRQTVTEPHYGVVDQPAIREQHHDQHDVPPGSTGKQSAYLTADVGQYATISTVFDTTPGKSFVQLRTGTQYQLQFKARGRLEHPQSLVLADAG